ncbi:hypothetical protein IF650_19455 [Cellulosimicrobium terreum]|nr:hypothetical protein [Cellulosimicrobium terreum]
MVRERWRHPNLTIIEDWIQLFINDEPTTRFQISYEKGGNRPQVHRMVYARSHPAALTGPALGGNIDRRGSRGY